MFNVMTSKSIYTHLLCTINGYWIITDNIGLWGVKHENDLYNISDIIDVNCLSLQEADILDSAVFFLVQIEIKS